MGIPISWPVSVTSGKKREKELGTSCVPRQCQTHQHLCLVTIVLGSGVIFRWGT